MGWAWEGAVCGQQQQAWVCVWGQTRHTRQGEGFSGLVARPAPGSSGQAGGWCPLRAVACGATTVTWRHAHALCTFSSDAVGRWLTDCCQKRQRGIWKSQTGHG